MAPDRPRGGERIAIVRSRWLWVEVTTDYRPRTDVERWQIQDRLVLRLQRMRHAARPRFYEGTGGRLAFRIRLGWRPAAATLGSLGSIDEPDGASGA